MLAKVPGLVLAVCSERPDIAFHGLQVIDVVIAIHHIVFFIAIDLEGFFFAGGQDGDQPGRAGLFPALPSDRPRWP